MNDETLESVLNAKTDAHRIAIEDQLPLFPGVLTFLKPRRGTFQLAS